MNSEKLSRILGDLVFPAMLTGIGFLMVAISVMIFVSIYMEWKRFKREEKEKDFEFKSKWRLK
jgi:hypothetical protein